METINKQIGNLQEEMMNMTIGNTKVISGRVITKWSKESYEIDTFGKATICSEHIAEAILNL
jgi:hypothetical protein